MKLEIHLLPGKIVADVVVVIDVLASATLASIFFDKNGEFIGRPQYQQGLNSSSSNKTALDNEKTSITQFLENKTVEKVAVLQNERLWQVVDSLATDNKTIILGSFYNAQAVRRTVLELTDEKSTVALMCLGSDEGELLEDTLCASLLAKKIIQNANFSIETDDTYLITENLLKSFPDPQEALVLSRAGQKLMAKKQQEDLAYASLISQSQAVTIFKGDGFYRYP